MKRIFLFVVLYLGISSFIVNSQSFFTPDDHMLNGFARKISGLDFEYHSCIPGLRESILVRATSGKDMMEWETSVVPQHITEKYATFVWIAALGSGAGSARMDLAVNERQSFSFYTDARAAWDETGEDGASLSFRSVMTDQHGDHHG